jgi:PhnB protein
VTHANRTKETPVNVQPYLYFGGRCEEAIEFYRCAIGAQPIMVMRFKEVPSQPPAGHLPAGWEAKVMHAAFTIGDSTLLASDGQGPEKANFAGITLTLNAASDAEAKRLFAALGDGGQVDVPLEKTFFASSFGMVHDRFGVSWIVIAGGQSP